MINGVKINRFNQHRLEENHVQKGMESKKQDEQKEIIRRLRIQNKKLQEQVLSLRKRLKKMETGKTRTITRLNRMLKINKSISRALKSCPHGEKILAAISAGLEVRGGKR
jgi:hypothetical protein